MEKYEDFSKNRLQEIIKKKITTTMIGALSAFEEQFSDLWENNPEMKDRWYEAKGKVLDLGNKQIKDLKEELKQHTINWDRYQYEIKFIRND